MVFTEFNIEQFWGPSEYAENDYVGVPVTDEQIAASVERELGYKLPNSLRRALRCSSADWKKMRCLKTVPNQALYSPPLLAA